MSLFQRSSRQPAILSDAAVQRYLSAVRAELSMDPLFRRRLRGTVVNRFVADREGRTEARPPRRMGALGRSVLNASVVLSVTVSSAMAAAQGAAPGDALYPLKLRIEQLRLDALPEQLHDDLAAHALGERIHELGVLAERGDWAGVETQAAAIETEYRHFVEVVGADASADRYLVVLDALLDRLPDRAQHAIEDRRRGSSVVDQVRDAGLVNGGGEPAGGGAGGPDATAQPTPESSAEPSRPARPEPAPRPSREPRPSADLTAPVASEEASPTPADLTAPTSPEADVLDD